MLAEGTVEFSRCQASLNGGAIFTSARIAFGTASRQAHSSITSNFASGSGGGVMAFSSVAELAVASGSRVVLKDNQASVDGGGLAFVQGAALSLAVEGCDPLTCSPSDIGNGRCDAPCLRRGCNW